MITSDQGTRGAVITLACFLGVSVSPRRVRCFVAWDYRPSIMARRSYIDFPISAKFFTSDNSTLISSTRAILSGALGTHPKQPRTLSQDDRPNPVASTFPSRSLLFEQLAVS